MNAGGVAGFATAGYDLHALAAHASHLVLMAYDEHGPWEATPGPVGALDWQRAGLRALETAVPRRQIILGVAGYGYSWGPHHRGQVSDRRARALAAAAGVPPRFDAQVGEWTARLPGGTVLWWSDLRSLALRLALARQDHLGGVAIWDLALCDPLRGLPAQRSSSGDTPISRCSSTSPSGRPS